MFRGGKGDLAKRRAKDEKRLNPRREKSSRRAKTAVADFKQTMEKSKGRKGVVPGVWNPSGEKRQGQRERVAIDEGRGHRPGEILFTAIDQL